MWPYVWIVFMLGLIVATTIIALREKKARDEAMKKMRPQPGGPVDSSMPMDDEGFGEADPMDGFGAQDDFASLDENSFK